ncbi:MAG: Na+/H+ antiporter NhaC family protein [Clostridia bacterium]|nr:Na+/H+ antiporter NhaC family protein [Clostridia bacterium]
MVQILVLLPPIIAIGLALLTKEVYSSLFIGVVVGALLFVLSGGADAGYFAGTGDWTWNFNIIEVLKTTIEEISATVDSYNMGILLFLVLLGMLVALVTKAGGSKAYGEWATTKFKSKKSSLLATSALGAIIFVDDYFNCLTVGTVMNPVTDKHKVSRAKLAYIIDSTAAPICIIAPVSSWGAAITGNMTVNNAFGVFLQTIPFNFYALLTIIFLVAIVCLNIDFGPMKGIEKLAEETGDLGNTQGETIKTEFEISTKGKVIDLIVPIVVLIVGAVFGMVYTGGLFDGETIIDAFTNCDAPVSLNMGAIFGLLAALIMYLPRKIITAKEYMESLLQGFKSMVPAIAILVLAWSLGYLCRYKLMLGDNIAVLFENAEGLLKVLPAILFVLAGFIGFSTGTSWGTMGILIPLAEGILGCSADPVLGISFDATPLLIICIAAVAAGAVLGDHISPISDTTIMASTGAQCNHLQHVSTQLPYALTVGAVCVLAFLTAGLCADMGYGAALGISWVVGIIGLAAAIVGVKFIEKKKSNK